MFVKFFALLALSLPVAAVAADQLIVDVPTIQDTPPKTAAALKEKLICKSDYSTGSFVKKTRWCASAADWRQSERAARTWTDTIQSNKGRFDGDASTTQGIYVTGSGIHIDH